MFNGHLGISSSAKRLFIYFAQFFLFIFSYSLVKDVYVNSSVSESSSNASLWRQW